MFDRKPYAQMRRGGMGIGISKAKLSQAMLEILVQLPKGTTNLKQTIVANLGLLGQMSATRDINEAWNQTKKSSAGRVRSQHSTGDFGVVELFGVGSNFGHQQIS